MPGQRPLFLPDGNTVLVPTETFMALQANGLLTQLGPGRYTAAPQVLQQALQQQGMDLYGGSMGAGTLTASPMSPMQFGQNPYMAPPMPQTPIWAPGATGYGMPMLAPPWTLGPAIGGVNPNYGDLFPTGGDNPPERMYDTRQPYVPRQQEPVQPRSVVPPASPRGTTVPRPPTPGTTRTQAPVYPGTPTGPPTATNYPGTSTGPPRLPVGNHESLPPGAENSLLNQFGPGRYTWSPRATTEYGQPMMPGLPGAWRDMTGTNRTQGRQNDVEMALRTVWNNRTAGRT